MPWLNRFDGDWLAAEVGALRARLRARGPCAGGRPRRPAARRAARAARSRSSASRAGPRAGRPTRRSASTALDGASLAARIAGARRRPCSMSAKRAWVVLPDLLSIRVFVDAGIVSGLDERLGNALAAVFLVPREAAAEWHDRLPDVPVLYGDELTAPTRARRPRLRPDRRLARPPARLPPARDPPQLPPRLPCRADAARTPELDARHRSRRPAPALVVARAGDGALVLQPAAARPAAAARDDAARLLRSRALERAAGERRAVPRRRTPPAAAGGRACGELGPHGRQGRDLAALRALPRPEQRHGGRSASLPRHRARSACGSPAGRKPTSSTAGGPGPSTTTSCAGTGSIRAARSCSSRETRPSNAPYEGLFVERLVAWWEQGDARAHPASLPTAPARPCSGGSGSRAAEGRDGVVVQEASYTDLDDLAALLQHVDVVVCNAGTILLDALVGDRPAVCVLYDEGAPPGESWAAKNVVGKHYEELAASGAFYRAESFDEVVAGIERALERPDELAAERRRAVEQVVGTVDGRAAERVVDAVVEGLGREAP